MFMVTEDSYKEALKHAPFERNKNVLEALAYKIDGAWDLKNAFKEFNQTIKEELRKGILEYNYEEFLEKRK